MKILSLQSGYFKEGKEKSRSGQKGGKQNNQQIDMRCGKDWPSRVIEPWIPDKNPTQSRYLVLLYQWTVFCLFPEDAGIDIHKAHY